MAMTKNDILDSGLLELYVLGELGYSDLKEVEATIAAYPELKNEIREIEKALHTYASIHSVAPSPGLLDSVMSKIRSDISLGQSPGSMPTFGVFSALLTFLAGSLIVATFLLSRRADNVQNELDRYQIACDSTATIQNDRIALLEDISDYNNRVIKVNATEKYPTTNLVLYNNEESGKNYLRIINLPTLNNNQSFQLWSLKGDNPPSPLDVFQQLPTDDIIPVDMIENSDAYAITIEALGGAQSPDLSNLIGIFPRA